MHIDYNHLDRQTDDKVSIIIPAYNAENYIERAVNSALRQTYGNIEIIVINDGSTDKTKEILEDLSIKYPNMHVIHTENKGVSCARNLGLDHATGEYFAFLDADDALIEDGIYSLLIEIQKNNLDIVSTKLLRLENDAPYEGGSNTESNEMVIYNDKESLLRSIEDYPETYSSCGKLYRREKLKEIRFPAGKRVHEDSFYIFQCLTKGISLGVLDKTVYINYITKNSASRGEFSEKVFDILELAEEKYKIIENSFPQYLEAAKLMLLKAHLALLKNLCKTKDRKYAPIKNKCINHLIQNKKYFKSEIAFDKKLFWIVTHHLYWLYEIIYRIKG